MKEELSMKHFWQIAIHTYEYAKLPEIDTQSPAGFAGIGIRNKKSE